MKKIIYSILLYAFLPMIWGENYLSGKKRYENGIPLKSNIEGFNRLCIFWGVLLIVFGLFALFNGSVFFLIYLGIGWVASYYSTKKYVKEELYEISQRHKQ